MCTASAVLISDDRHGDRGSKIAAERSGGSASASLASQASGRISLRVSGNLETYRFAIAFLHLRSTLFVFII